MYDPTIGRWISEDPIGFEAADPNLYRYVENNPTNATDPSGLTQHAASAPSNETDSGRFPIFEGVRFEYRGHRYLWARNRHNQLMLLVQPLLRTDWLEVAHLRHNWGPLAPGDLGLAPRLPGGHRDPNLLQNYFLFTPVTTRAGGRYAIPPISWVPPPLPSSPEAIEQYFMRRPSDAMVAEIRGGQCEHDPAYERPNPEEQRAITIRPFGPRGPVIRGTAEVGAIPGIDYEAIAHVGVPF